MFHTGYGCQGFLNQIKAGATVSIGDKANTTSISLFDQPRLT
jgi:hypothetical protein